MTVKPAIDNMVLDVYTLSKKKVIGDCLAWIRRLPGEQLLPQCTIGHAQAVLCFGVRSFWAFLGPVVVVELTMNATGYLNIIADQLNPYMASVFPDGNGMFQQDNAPCHKAKIVLEWFQEHDAEFQLMSWLPNSPDFNQI
ncbi:transposase domain containing protein [Trichonephila clavipes]|nr:transposase domain containing protein [Trichonephila clavipes]